MRTIKEEAAYVPQKTRHMNFRPLMTSHGSRQTLIGKSKDMPALTIYLPISLHTAQTRLQR